MADQSGYHFNGVTPMNSVTAEITIVSIVNETVTNASSTLSLEDKQTIQYLQDVRKSILDWYMWVIFAFGFPGNLMGLVIILRLRCFGSPAVYVGTLAVVDNLAIILKVTLVILAEQKVVLGLYGCKILYFLGNFLQVYPNWILVSMAIERFVAVWQPLHVASSWTSRRAGLTLVLVMILVVALNAPIWVFAVDRPGSSDCTTDDNYRSQVAAWQWVQVVAYGFIPCVLLITLNVFIVVIIRRATRHQQSMTGSTSSPSQYPHPSHSRAGVQSQVTALLVVTSAVLVLTTTPVCVYMLVQTSWKPPEGTLEHYRKSLISTAVRVVCDANHSVNFYLYFIRVKDRSSGYLLLFKRKRSAYERCANNQIVMKDMPNNVDKGNGHETVRKVCSGENTV
nr:hypothetical protein BaRGS_018692 [Batillaria attramentaria]